MQVPHFLSGLGDPQPSHDPRAVPFPVGGRPGRGLVLGLAASALLLAAAVSGTALLAAGTVLLAGGALGAILAGRRPPDEAGHVVVPRPAADRMPDAEEAAGTGSFAWEPGSAHQDWSRGQHALFGTDPEAPGRPCLDQLLALAHPEDQAPLRAALARAAETGEYHAEFRIRPHDTDSAAPPRWLLGRGRLVPGRDGRRDAILGVHVDITARRQEEIRQALLIREVDHRAKNALAVVQAVLRLTRAADQESYTRSVEGRVAALARAQTLLTQACWSGADLRALLEGELAPFLCAGGIGPGVVLDGPPVLLAPVSTQPLSMTIHELATNAMKHGALSVPGGQVRVAWTVRQEADERRLGLTWEETGGPPVAGPPARLGFGSRVLEATVRDQLGGRVELGWPTSGLRCSLDIPLPDPSPALRAPDDPPGR